ncbi:hypothetical protein OAT84_01315 [Gammaproteobacteria bacterium]|nr:hypothetical protein [Gammaproteobacteria bacterium]
MINESDADQFKLDRPFQPTAPGLPTLSTQFASLKHDYEANTAQFEQRLDRLENTVSLNADALDKHEAIYPITQHLIHAHNNTQLNEAKSKVKIRNEEISVKLESINLDASILEGFKDLTTVKDEDQVHTKPLCISNVFSLVPEETSTDLNESHYNLHVKKPVDYWWTVRELEYCQTLGAHLGDIEGVRILPTSKIGPYDEKFNKVTRSENHMVRLRKTSRSLTETHLTPRYAEASKGVFVLYAGTFAQLNEALIQLSTDNNRFSDEDLKPTEKYLSENEVICPQDDIKEEYRYNDMDVDPLNLCYTPTILTEVIPHAYAESPQVTAAILCQAQLRHSPIATPFMVTKSNSVGDLAKNIDTIIKKLKVNYHLLSDEHIGIEHYHFILKELNEVKGLLLETFVELNPESKLYDFVKRCAQQINHNYERELQHEAITIIENRMAQVVHKIEEMEQYNTSSLSPSK